ncbi:MAG: alpha/beta fold hydrolase [Brevundimonas sp.]
MTDSGDVATNLIDRKGRERERRFIELPDGLSLAYTDEGEGRPVVLLHGVLTTLEDMTLTLGSLLASGHRVIAFDRPGFGRSDARRFLDAGPWRQADRLHQALDLLGLEDPIIIGHSFGATVALCMAVGRPGRLAGVVALAPVVQPELRLEHLLFGPRGAPTAPGWLSPIAAATSDRVLLPILWRAMYLPQAVPSAVLADFPFALAGRSDAAVRVAEDSVAALPDLLRLTTLAPGCHIPIRILGGDRDLVVRNGVHGRWLAGLLPRGRFIDLPGLGHMIHHFAAPDIVRETDALIADPT